MGFGFLLIGYFIESILSYNSFGAFFILLGSYIMFMGLLTLVKYSKKYMPALIISVALVILGLYESIALVLNMLPADIPLFFTASKEILSYFRFGLGLLFHASILYAIFSMCCDLDVPKGKSGAIRNMVMSGIYYLILFISIIPTSFKESFMRAFVLPMILWMFALYISMILLFLTCYAQICPEGEEDMHRKPSRFAFINRIHEQMDERAERARKSTEAYIADRQKKQAEKKQNKRK